MHVTRTGPTRACLFHSVACVQLLGCLACMRGMAARTYLCILMHVICCHDRDATSADEDGEVNQPPRKQLKPNPPDGVLSNTDPREGMLATEEAPREDSGLPGASGNGHLQEGLKCGQESAGPEAFPYGSTFLAAAHEAGLIGGRHRDGALDSQNLEAVEGIQKGGHSPPEPVVPRNDHCKEGNSPLPCNSTFSQMLGRECTAARGLSL